jgi:hypothetical protein
MAPHIFGKPFPLPCVQTYGDGISRKQALGIVLVWFKAATLYVYFLPFLLEKQTPG